MLWILKVSQQLMCSKTQCFVFGCLSYSVVLVLTVARQSPGVLGYPPCFELIVGISQPFGEPITTAWSEQRKELNKMVGENRREGIEMCYM